MTPYEAHQKHCIEAARRWERAAETARVAGNLGLAFTCSQRAIKCWYLGDLYPAPEEERAFNAEGNAEGVL